MWGTVSVQLKAYSPYSRWTLPTDDRATEYPP